MVIIGYIRSRPADLFKHSSSGTSKLMTTSRPLAGSAGGGVGRGSFTRLDLFIFPADLSSFLSPAEKPVRAFSRTLAWYKLVGNPSIIQPVSSGIHLKWSVLIKKRLWFIIEVSKNGWSKLYTHGYTCTCIHLWLAFFLLIKTKNKELFWPDGFYQNVNNHLIINRLSFLQVFQGLGSKLGFRSWLLKKKYKNFNQMDLKLIKIRG